MPIFASLRRHGPAPRLTPLLTRSGRDSGAAALGPASTTRSSLLLQDLQRLAQDPGASDLLCALAAGLRCGKPMTLGLSLDERPLDLHLDPARQVWHCTLDLCTQGEQALSALRLVRVEPDTLAPPAHDSPGRPLRQLLWHLALRGARTELLPALAGQVRCRVVLGVPLSDLAMDSASLRVIQRMKSAPVALDDLLPGSTLQRPAVQRIWNALYLQSALMVTRGLMR